MKSSYTYNIIALLMCLCWTLGAEGRSRVLSPNVQSLQVVVGQDFLSPPVMRLGSDDVLHVSFDELSHQYHRYVYHVELCNADWQPNSSAFDNDYLQGFNDNPIEDYQNSEGTNQLYTHYRLQLPNERCRLKMGGNYRLTVFDDDADGIKTIQMNNEENNNGIYNLAGQRVLAPSKGIYIVNGKKVILK